MRGAGFLPRLTYGSATGWFLLAAIIALPFADLSISAVHPGAEAALTQKSLGLIGGPAAMTPIAGHTPGGSIFLADKADLLLYYCSGKDATMRDVPGLASVRLPPEIDVVATYGLAVLSDNPAAARLALFLLSDKGQAILSENGLVPVAR